MMRVCPTTYPWSGLASSGERELAEVKRLLSERRLLTLCGPGGAGKTRLALTVARDEAAEFEGGARWVELAPVSDPELVSATVTQAVGVPEAPDLSPTEALVGHMKGRKALLVLDNCEHLIEACAALADALLGTCPELRILATSREPLRVRGETNFMVPSLSVPDPRRSTPLGELERYEAVRLFVERAREVDTGFALTEGNASAVARLCDKLDGIPLALELAAARTRVLSIEQISEKLEDPLGLLTTGNRTAARRHRTLRATPQWSYGLLGEAEQALFRRLPAALWRFWGGQRFEEGKQWLQTALERDSGGFPAVRARALDGLGFILLFQQDYERAIASLEEAVALYEELGDQSGAAFALGNLGWAVLHGGYTERVHVFVREAEALMQGNLDDHARAFLSIVRAGATIGREDLDPAVAQLKQSLALCRELGDLRNTSMSLFMLGNTELRGGNLGRG